MLLETTALTGITAKTWFITGLGFGMVLLLLIAFVFIMKLLGWIMRPRVKAVKKEENTQQAETVVHKERSERMVLTADSTAAIALALHLYYNGVHDEEDTKITIQPHRTQWNNKMYGMNNLHR
ncbi:MAG: OadG family protein [Paludibacteraceae bacterium]